MRREPLPPSLAELEGRLARRPTAEPTAEFRSRVLTGMAGSRDRTPRRHSAGRWRLVCGAAAAVILALNLALSVGNGVRFQLLTPAATPEGNVARLSGALDAGDPVGEVAAAALANVTPGPDAGTLARRLFSNEEERGWLTP